VHLVGFYYKNVVYKLRNGARIIAI